MRRATTRTALVAALVAAAASIGAGGAPGLFVTSDRCQACHNGLVAPNGADVSIGSDWRGSMMANSSRDPYWQAAVCREGLVRPAIASEIEHECAACHMPMARFETAAGGGTHPVFASLAPAAAATPAGLLSRDGVSCAMCHQIADERLGESASFTAGFSVDGSTPLGARAAYGPYDVDPGRAALMRSAALLEPIRAGHVQSSELCATCHTLYTHALDENGAVVAEFPEQVPYLEWRHSAYAGVSSCQSCHMPVVPEPVAISSTLGVPREQVSRHVFRGGNVVVPRMLELARDALGVTATARELAATAERTAANLATASASLAIDSLDLDGDRLAVGIRVTNMAGHKLPTAYPSRRAWLHVAVRDVAGDVVFESGRLRPDGSIVGNDNDDDPARYEPHRDVVSAPDQVQIYEPVLAGADGSITTVLLTAASYAKDNRLLPDGFDPDTAPDDVAVRGRAADDDSFVGGGDRVRYEVDLAGARGPFVVTAELLYQPIGYRWARNLATTPAPEIERFVTLYEAVADVSSATLARAEARTGGG